MIPYNHDKYYHCFWEEDYTNDKTKPYPVHAGSHIEAMKEFIKDMLNAYDIGVDQVEYNVITVSPYGDVMNHYGFAQFKLNIKNESSY